MSKVTKSRTKKSTEEKVQADPIVDEQEQGYEKNY